MTDHDVICFPAQQIHFHLDDPKSAATKMPGYGFAVTRQRRVSKRTTVAGGFSDIDRRYSSLSSDPTGTGRRVLGSIGVRIGKAWLGSVQVARAGRLDPRPADPVRPRALRAWSSARSER